MNLYQCSNSQVTVLAGCTPQGEQQPVHSSEDGLVAEVLTTGAPGPHCTLQNIKGPGRGAWLCNSSPCRAVAGRFLGLLDSQPILTSEFQAGEQLCLKSKVDSVPRNDTRLTMALASTWSPPFFVRTWIKVILLPLLIESSYHKE